MDTRKTNDTPDLHMPWKIKGGFLFESKPLLINAPPAKVWKKITDISHYDIYSNNTITTRIEGMPELNKYFKMELYKKDFIGNFIPASTEYLSCIKDCYYKTGDEKYKMGEGENYLIGWEREIKGSGTTERYHKLEGIDNNKRCLSSIALRVPGAAGLITHFFYRKPVENAFDSLNEGIKNAVEKEEESEQVKLR